MEWHIQSAEGKRLSAKNSIPGKHKNKGKVKKLKYNKGNVRHFNINKNWENALLANLPYEKYRTSIKWF